MPCYRCDRVQTDPARGGSPWKRGVRRGVQVLVCPDCQQAHEWARELDRCDGCGSTRLSRALGETRCAECGLVVADAAPPPSRPAPPRPLADDVSAALRKVFGADDAR